MTYEQLLKRINKNNLTNRKLGKLHIAEIPAGTPEDHAIEFLSFVTIAHKYRDAYKNGENVPDDLTDEIFAQIELTKKMFADTPGKYGHE